MKGILDRRFVYTPSFATDIRKTFERVRREREPERRASVRIPQKSAKVLRIDSRKADAA
jgi:hypothetical protein